MDSTDEITILDLMLSTEPMIASDKLAYRSGGHSTYKPVALNIRSYD